MAKYQYIGDGADSPERIMFMGQIAFTLNHKGVEVTDPKIIFKLEGNKSFKLMVDAKPVKKAVKAKPVDQDVH